MNHKAHCMWDGCPVSPTHKTERVPCQCDGALLKVTACEKHMQEILTPAVCSTCREPSIFMEPVRLQEQAQLTETLWWRDLDDGRVLQQKTCNGKPPDDGYVWQRFNPDFRGPYND